MSRPATPMLLFVLMVVRHEGRYLLVEETGDFKGLWYLPAGGVEAGENLIQAGQREAFEEAGVKVELGAMLELQHEPPSATRPRGSMRFIFEAALAPDSQPPRTTPNEHTLGARFFTLDEIRALPLRSQYVPDLLARHAQSAHAGPGEPGARYVAKFRP